MRYIVIFLILNCNLLGMKLETWKKFQKEKEELERKEIIELLEKKVENIERENKEAVSHDAYPDCLYKIKHKAKNIDEVVEYAKNLCDTCKKKHLNTEYENEYILDTLITTYGNYGCQEKETLNSMENGKEKRKKVVELMKILAKAGVGYSEYTMQTLKKLPNKELYATLVSKNKH